MPTQFATSIVTEKESLKAGQLAAQEAMGKMSKKKADVALVFASSNHDYAQIAQGIASVIGDEVPIVGCSSAGEFTNESVTKGGLACALIQSDVHRFFSGIGHNLRKDSIEAVRAATKEFPEEVEEMPFKSALLFIDGLAGKGEETVFNAAKVMGPEVSFVGGAAGDDLKFKKTEVFSNSESASDALSICKIASKKPIIISLKHGHKPLSPPLKITKAQGTILYEIENRPAIEVWKQYIRHKALEMGIDVNTTDQDILSRLLLKHEAGIQTGNDFKIRFPVSCNPDGSLNFICAIQEGNTMHIMDSQDEDQIESARVAAETALRMANGVPIAGAIVFDCACRAMILKERFASAVGEMKRVFKNIPLIGIETYGEIAMGMGHLSGFHNTTTVIMLVPA